MQSSKTILLNNEEESKFLAHSIAKDLRAADIITFSGDLGSGKTFICREIIRHLSGINYDVTSPTFNLLQIYTAPKFLIYHFDLYRLNNSSEIYELGIEEAFQGNLCLIEWPQIIEEMLPLPITKIHLQITDNNKRQCTIDYLE